jgi:UDP-N-acetylglucosamine diphosphorylase/glucosamine-1-phosphate N-acetyltransferase
MPSIVFDQTGLVNKLYPFTETRDILDIRVGILTLREKWQLLLPQYLNNDNSSESITVSANILLSRQLSNLILAGRYEEKSNSPLLKKIEYPWHIFELNDFAIREDFEILTANRVSEVIPETVQVSRSTRIFIEEGADLSHCVLNAEPGPIYIGKDAKVMEGAYIRGPFALGEGGVVKMGAKIYGATTIGPYSVAGGEIKNAVIFGYSNKAHDGYLGDSVIGEWCNLGAGTSNSNVSNTGGNVSVWNPASNGFVVAGNKCGLFMGDYSRSAINACFNTGTVVGVSCNIFGDGLSPKHIPHFSWGIKPSTKYEFDKAIRDIANWKKMKNHSLSESEIQQLKIIFDRT